MINSALVHIPTERPSRPVIDASLLLASTFGARLEGIATGFVSTSPYVIAGSSAAALGAVYEIEQDRATERATAAISIFEARARNAGICYQSRTIVDLVEEGTASIAAASRLHDLSVVLQPDPDHHTADSAVPTDILLQSGGPVLFVPYIFRNVFKPRRIGVCWDGSRMAARALRDAEPFLAQADSLFIISINSGQSSPSNASAEQLVEHLSRYGRPATLIASPAARSKIQPSILSLDADRNFDMLVMGAYGHSRLEERLFGGVTHEMLQAMTVPTLMSH